MINPLGRIEVNHFVVRHPAVGQEQAGLKIAHVTDVHHGRWVKSHHVRQLVDYVNGHGVDLTVLTGDYVGYSRRSIEPCITSFAGLESPAYATLGNHDHWASTERTHEAFASIGLPVLTNTSTVLDLAQCKLRIVGIDDAVTKNADVDAAFANVRDDDGFRLVLCHVPELAADVAKKGGHLVLSGHTHGLQFNVKLSRRLAHRFGMTFIGGGYRLDNTLLYVSRGLGSASWPWRYRAAPELAFFILEPAQRAEILLDHRTITRTPRRRPRRRRRALPGPPDDS